MAKVAPPIEAFGDLTDPPKELFYEGKWDEGLLENCVAVVGSRKITEYGKRVIEKVVTDFVGRGWTIVSGFMYGADQYAHKVCIENGGRTVAVLGWGIDIPLDEHDRELADSILGSGGLLVSEWRDQKGALWTFPRRNRIVAALSKEVVIVEAAIKSGSLITAELAVKLKRKIWAVPGPITSKVSEGTNGLIAAGVAQMWLSQTQLNLEEFDHDPIFNLLLNEPLDASELSRRLGKKVEEIGARLSILTLAGVIIERGGKYYVSEG